ncbi:hypothetical protein [Myxosarcina sp. GI1(2024)]
MGWLKFDTRTKSEQRSLSAPWGAMGGFERDSPRSDDINTAIANK